MSLKVGTLTAPLSRITMPNHPPVEMRAQVDPEYCAPGSFAGTQAGHEALTLVSVSWTSVTIMAALALIGATVLTRSYWASHQVFLSPPWPLSN